MKRILLLIAAGVFALSANAQDEKKHELSVGAGVWSSNEIVGTLTDLIVSGLPGIELKNGEYLGALSVSYKYLFSPRVAIGGTFGFDYGSTDAVFEGSKIGNAYSSFYTLAAEGQYSYLQNGNWSVYALLGLGGTLLHQSYKPDSGDKKSNNNVFFNYQMTPVGVKFGNSFGIYAELGFGYKGILSAGVFGRF